MADRGPLIEGVARLLDPVRELANRGEEAAWVESIAARLGEPPRIAIAGRVKAGKSTLLNALIGERLAATDAGECTRIVTWYRQGVGYEVTAFLRDGGSRPLQFRRENGTLDIDLGDLTPPDVSRLEVRWPSQRLSRMTLIDTPGVEGMDDTSAGRTREFLGLDDEGHSEVDAVVYLMRHLHRHDAEFLEAFLDRSVARPSPANAVAVLSRADELGAGRLDALETAEAIAGRYASDDRVRGLCATVVPVAGLVAETGATLREEETAALRELASLDADELGAMLLSVDRFCRPEFSPLAPERRAELLARLGLFGVKFSLHQIRQGHLVTASELSRALIDASGIRGLAAVLDSHFADRAQLLKARAALGNLKALVPVLAEPDESRAQPLLAAIEELEAGAHELAEQRLLHMMLSGAVELSDEERGEVHRLLAGADPASRLGFEADHPDASALESVALGRVDYWRRKAGHPLATRTVQEAGEIVARSYEGLIGSLRAGGGEAAPAASGVSRFLATAVAIHLADSDEAGNGGLQDGTVREVLEGAGSRTIRVVADGYLALFDSAMSAAEGARSIVQAARDRAVETRLGLHAGECELRGSEVGGAALHVAAAVASLAEPEEVLVTETVRELLQGADLEFVDRGPHSVPGLPGEWRLFAFGD